MDNPSQSVYDLSVQHQIQADETGSARLSLLIVEAGESRRDGLQLIVETASKLS